QVLGVQLLDEAGVDAEIEGHRCRPNTAGAAPAPASRGATEELSPPSPRRGGFPSVPVPVPEIRIGQGERERVESSIATRPPHLGSSGSDPRSAASVKHPASVAAARGASLPSPVPVRAVALRRRLPASGAGPLLCCCPAMDDLSDQGAPVELSEEETVVMLGCYAETPIVELSKTTGLPPARVETIVQRLSKLG